MRCLFFNSICGILCVFINVMCLCCHCAHQQHSEEETEVRYSSFQCTAGGNQKFPAEWNFYDETFNRIDNRVCKFKNVCLDENLNFFNYYQHPEELKAPQFAQLNSANLFLPGMLEKFTNLDEWALDMFRIVKSAIPRDVPFIDNRTWLYTSASYSYNYAHLLLDDLFPAIAALDIFNIDFSEEERGHAAIIYSGCEDLHTVIHDVSSYPTSNKYDRSDEEFKFNACTDNFKKYSKLIFGDEATPLTSLKGRTLCFEQLIIGQGGSLNMGCVDKQRAVTLRKGRDAIVRSLNLHDKPSPQGLSVMVLTKHTWPTMCEDTSRPWFTSSCSWKTSPSCASILACFLPRTRLSSCSPLH